MSVSKQVIKRLERLFFARLNKKTGWGKEQVKKEFREALVEALLEDG